jgi:multiple sugar transport system substrate-binding protein
MPEEIEFSIMDSSEERIRPLLARFEAESQIRVNLRLLDWDQAWGVFVRAGLYHDGPDVSEVGTTWMGDLVGMNALRSFEMAEVVSLGKAAAFLPAAWKSAVRPSGGGSERVWAVPWTAGARMLFYRPALLQAAGVDLGSAFASNEALEDTIQRLAKAGVPVPWTVPTGSTHTTLLNIASWVWAAGGDFIAPDGKSTSFLQPEAVRGMRDYFTLGRYLVPEVRRLNGLEPDDHFLHDPGAAMTMSGPWLFCRASRLPGDLSAQIETALPPGGSFVGGSNLVIWNHSRHSEEAVRLVRFLTQHSVQVDYAQRIGLLPARLESLSAQPFVSDRLWGAAVEGLQHGRTFPPIRLWGLVEDRLAAVLSVVWVDVLSGAEPSAALIRHLEPLARRLDPLLLKE